MSRPLYTTDIKSISDLTEVTTLADSSNLLIQSGTNFYKLTGARLASYYINGTDYRILLTGNDLGIRANNIGLSADTFNFGYYGKVTDFGAIHFGWRGEAGLYCTHFGLSGESTGYGSFHIGLNGTARGFAAFCGGWRGKASSAGAFHMGLNGLAAGSWSTHFGWSGSATGQYSTHLGAFGQSDGVRSLHTGFGGLLSSTATNSSHFGSYGVATRRNEMVHSGELFGTTNGSCQTMKNILRVTTSNATPVELTLNGDPITTPERLIIPVDTTWFYDVKIAARNIDTPGECAAYRIEGCIDNNAGTVALVGPPTYTVIGEDVTSWSISAEADDTNKALKLSVQSDAGGDDVRWVASVEIVQVKE
jgi:hypothetical protein